MSWIRHVVAAAALVGMLWAQGGSPPSSGPDAVYPQIGNAEPPSGKPSLQAPPDSSTLLAVKVIKPIYPITADKDKLEGQVVLKIVVSETGDVETVEVENGNPTLAQAAIEAAREWKFKPFIRNGKAVKTSTKMVFNFVFRDQIPDDPSVMTAAPPQSTPPTLSLTTVRVSLNGTPSNGTPKMLLKKVEPVYPEIAKAARISGAVVMFAVIGKDGTVTVLHLISGHPLLAPAALRAVKEWRYRPFILNGEPVEFQTTITVHFTLSGL